MSRIGACFDFAFGAVPYRALRAGGAGLGWFIGRVLRHRRALVLEALGRCLPERGPEEHRRIADGMYRHLGTLILECLYFCGRRAPRFREHVEIKGREHLEAVRARGTGALMLIGHIGNWELMGLAMSSLWRPIHVVVRPLGNRRFNDFWLRARARMDLLTLPRENAIRDCLKALKRRDMVVLILDQNMRRHRGIFVDFFGRPACTTPGLALLSAASRTPVIPIYIHRKPDGDHQVVILPPIEPPPGRSEELIRDATQQYTRALEDIIREHPDQWIWLHKRWRTRPEDPIDP